MPEVHETENAQEDICVAGAGVIEDDSEVDGVIDDVSDIEGVFDGVVDSVGEFVAVTDGVTVRDREDVSVAEVDGVPEAEPPAVIEDVGVAEGEQDTNEERPATSQQVHGIGATDASGQKFPTGQIVGADAPLVQKLPAEQGSVATVHVMPA